MNIPTLAIRGAFVLAGLFTLMPIGVATASPLPGSYTYSTTSSLGSGAGTLSFHGVSSAALDPPGALSLGQFQVGALPDGASLTYSNFTFTIDMQIDKTLDNGQTVPSSDLKFLGRLQGTLSGSSQSNLSADVDLSSLQISGPDPLPFSSTFSVGTTNPLSPSSVNGGLTTWTLNVNKVPEPTSWAIVALAFGAGLYRFRRAG